ncbi:MAG: hypothetical protein ACW986_09515 [Promethearchaeota archaeon]|jgi:hypothetical protein
MPHFGLIDESLSLEEQYLMRARLHIKGGKIRLQRKEFSAGIAALYDAFCFALYWVFLSDPTLKPLLFYEDRSYEDEDVLYSMLEKYGKVDGTFDIQSFTRVTIQGLEGKLLTTPEEKLLIQFDHLMEQLKVTPYDDTLLPKEHAITL